MCPTFRKSERLASRLVIDEIFSKGKELKKFPFVMKYLVENDSKKEPVQIVFSVPKRKVKHAVDRNRLRRQIKEAYRLNKADFRAFFEKQESSIVIFLIYTGKEKEIYAMLEEKLKLILKELIQKLSCKN